MRPKLAEPGNRLAERYSVIVVGSGYGGAIMGARLAEHGCNVCILERGREWTPTEFPDTPQRLLDSLYSSDKPLGLFDYRRNEQVDVLIGCGLGGTSLINAGVAIEPLDSVFQHPRWPHEIRALGRSGLGPYFGKVREMLAVAKETRALPKTRAHARSSAAGHGSYSLLDVAVNFDTFEGEQNPHGIMLHGCRRCGDCMTGCNVGAKNTLDVNYLPFAASRGAGIFVGVEVEHISKASVGGYFGHCRIHDQNGRPTETKTLHANVVVLAAGALGSPEILLRSRQRGLPLSERLGYSFSGNGDILGFGYNNDVRTDIMGFGTDKGQDLFGNIGVGPLIASVIDYRSNQGRGGKGFIIEEGCVPHALVDVIRASLPFIPPPFRQDTDEGLADSIEEGLRMTRDLNPPARDVDGALNHSMVYLGMGHDHADGVLALDSHGRVRIHWDTAPDEPVFNQIADEMYRLTERLGGAALRNQSWVPVIGGKVVTVHPLGGCAMGQDVGVGVVDHGGRVFDPSDRGRVHEGLYVADGSIVPVSVGANPLLTISALTERAAGLLLRHDNPPKEPRTGALGAISPPPLPIGLEFTEEMKGHTGHGVTDAQTPDEYQVAARRGRRRGQTAGFKLTIFVTDVDQFVSNEAHEAVAIGSVEVAGRRFMVQRGVFNLFVESDDGKSKRMKYSLRFQDDADRPRLLQGFKIIRDDPGLDPTEIWRDATTLFVTLHSGMDENDPVLQQGILRISVPGFLNQLTTFRVQNAPDQTERVRAMEKFMTFFFKALWDQYVGLQLSE